MLIKIYKVSLTLKKIYFKMGDVGGGGYYC